ncbi:tRNA guanosine(34) transglycosylase Tgt [Candidatus Roizmanbacteria bacterium]|nr:tRNA guanosine(34) transglycosylase Tgt [Candidatus Roizmanbacteria bacterium]
MATPYFSVLSKSKKSRARTGVIHTSHGEIQTPAFVSAATKATIKSLTPSEISQVGTQAGCVNTYHLVMHPGVELLQKAGGAHSWANLSLPLMSDSGGFQVFSLAQNKRRASIRGEEETLLLKMSEDGVIFRSVYDGTVQTFTPETVMRFEQAIGADFIMAFDECVYYPSTHEYAQKSTERTHRWLERCVAEFQKIKEQNPENYQHLYGIIQGGTFEDLRIASAKFVHDQPTDGVAIGGVSVGEPKEEMRKEVSWVAPYLPLDRPVHLLGVGHVDDIVDLVVHGIDTFDCVEPTRHARMGSIYQWKDMVLMLDKLESERIPYAIDINHLQHKNDQSPLDENCTCEVCTNVSKSYLHHLFKQKELLAYTYATMHNLTLMNRLMAEIRRRIEEE